MKLENKAALFLILGVLLLSVGVLRAEDKKSKGTAPAKSDIQVIQGDTTRAPRKGKPTLRMLGDTVRTMSGLKYIDIRPGTGGSPRPGNTVSIHFVGRLPDGSTFDSTRVDEKPYEFSLGQGKVIDGLDEGVASMRIGGVRKLIIPFELGYGEQGKSPMVPPKSTLVYEVELVGIR